MEYNNKEVVFPLFSRLPNMQPIVVALGDYPKVKGNKKPTKGPTECFFGYLLLALDLAMVDIPRDNPLKKMVTSKCQLQVTS